MDESTATTSTVEATSPSQVNESTDLETPESSATNTPQAAAAQTGATEKVQAYLVHTHTPECMNFWISMTI